MTESRRLLEKLIREITRAETQAIDHPVREAKRIGETAPIVSLREVATHAAAMRTRFQDVLHAHEISVHRGTLGATLATLRHLVVDRVIDAERSFRTALLDLRHGIDVVKLLREVARREELFGVIRWCDDWLGARRTLVARVEAQLAWFAEQHALSLGHVPVSADAPIADGDDEGVEDDFEVLSSAGDPDKRPGPTRFRDRP
ncbi:MAG: hypothetical protein JWP01_3522 [Myxococcales bacterium]|nr:hypothetical protein [Myxococcales bacterium]